MKIGKLVSPFSFYFTSIEKIISKSGKNSSMKVRFMRIIMKTMMIVVSLITMEFTLWGLIHIEHTRRCLRRTHICNIYRQVVVMINFARSKRLEIGSSYNAKLTNSTHKSNWNQLHDLWPVLKKTFSANDWKKIQTELLMRWICVIVDYTWHHELYRSFGAAAFPLSTVTEFKSIQKSNVYQKNRMRTLGW